MPYLIFSTLKGRELARQALRSSLVVGRAPECDVCVHDIMLSRRHCRFEPDGEGGGWVLIDLASKNGTFVSDAEMGDREIGRHVLRDGETFRIGKTSVTFRAGSKLRSSPRGGRAYSRPNKGRARPADPWAAMHDTMSGYDYVRALAEEKGHRIDERRVTAARKSMTNGPLPTPQPRPRDPNAFKADDIYTLLTELASSSWDSIYMNASRPSPLLLTRRPATIARHPRRPATPVDLSIPAKPSAGLLAARIEEKVVKPPASRFGRALRGAARTFRAVGQSVIVLGIAHLLSK